MRIRQSLTWLLGISLVGSCISAYGDDAGSEQSKPIRAWAQHALLGERIVEPPPGPGLEVVRQD